MHHASFVWTPITTNRGFIGLREEELRGEGDKSVSSRGGGLRDDESKTKETDAKSKAREGKKAKETGRKARGRRSRRRR